MNIKNIDKINRDFLFLLSGSVVGIDMDYSVSINHQYNKIKILPDFVQKYLKIMMKYDQCLTIRKMKFCKNYFE